jgi:hypothetical protein
LADKYKLYGSKREGERVDRVLLKGTSSDPEEYLEVGGEAVELNEEQVASLRAQGIDIRKSGSTDDDDDNQPGAEQQGAEQGAADAPATNPPGDNPGGKK